MSTRHWRPIDDRHPIAGWLFRALKHAEIALTFAGADDAKRAAAAMAGFRRKGRLGPPGSFDPSTRDPRGEGVGFFDRVVISRRGVRVVLRHLPDGYRSLRANEIAPLDVEVFDEIDEELPDTCSHVNPEDFDVVTG